MNTETKYRVASCLVVMSLISCSMSLIALYIAIPQIPNNTYDYNGALVTILSVLVTLLLGWNIYTVVDFNRKVEKAEEKVGEEIEVMKPDGENVCVTVKGIWDDEGNQMESAPHPKQKLWIDLGVELDRFDILRRKEME